MFALLTRRGAAVAVSASMLVTCQGLAAPSLIMLPNLPNSFDMVPKAVSADGLTVVGDAYPNGSPRAFRWSAAGGIEDLGAFPGAVSSARAVSADGRIVVGTSGGKAFRWVEGSGMHELGTPANAFGSPATGVSADGQVVCGWAWFPPQTRSYRWTQAQGLEYLPMLPPGSGLSYLAAAGISADGLVIVGTGTIDDRGRAFRWTSSTGTVDLGTFPMGFYSEAYATSADGAVVIGLSSSVELSTRGFVWTQQNGIVPMSMLPGGATSQPRAMSADGSVIVGQSYWETTSRRAATMWKPSLGVVDLNEYLPSIGINLGTWTLEDAVGISGDGTAIAGRGRLGTNPRTWFVSGLESTLPPCIGDGTGDRAVTFADITSALGNWGRSYAFAFGPGDCDGNRMVDMNDVTTVLMHFGEACM